MKNPMQKFRRFFVRSRRFNAAAAQTATHTASEDDSDSTRLSGAFIVVLALHIIAVVGVFAFARIKESRKGDAAPQGNPRQTASPKNAPVKPVAVKPVAPVAAASIAAANPAIAPHATPKPAATAQNTPAPTEAKPAQTNVQKAAAAPADRKATRNYVVRKNDNPVKIAREQGCNYDELMKVNNIKDPKKIQTGQVLTIPVKKG